MKKKIQDMILGKFEYEKPQLVLPDGGLTFSVIENETYEGSFMIGSPDGNARGIVTCPNPNITCLTSEFEGKKTRVLFSYHTEQLVEGETDSGYFVITSNAGEFLLDFRASITKEYIKSSIGRIKTLNDFTNLAKLNWKEAVKVFHSPHFANIFHAQDEFFRLLYQGIAGKNAGSHEMEEFLIGCGKKKRSNFSVDREDRMFLVGREQISDEIVLTKSEWGYFGADLSCDADFVKLSRDRVQMDDFVGKHAKISYEILPEHMHRGKNFAVITVENCFARQTVTIKAERRRKDRERSPQSEKRELMSGLVRAFVDYQAGVSDKEVWSDKTLGLLNKIRIVDPSNSWYVLFTAYVLWVSGRKESAKGQMETFPRKQKNQRVPLSAFYRYLTVLDEEDGDELRGVYLFVREVFAKYPSHPVLFWIMLQMDEAWDRNPGRKYQAIKEYVTEYSASPVFYLEAAKLLWKMPELLHGQDVFEKRLIRWMAKKDFLNEALALRILEFAQTKRQFEPAFFRLLTKCYKLFPNQMAVKSICSYLIKMNCYGELYFPWFERGIGQHLKIAGLYEAYMMSWNKADGTIPASVLKYFSRTSSLPAKRKARLFAYVIQNREQVGSDWEPYLEMIRDFAAEELKKGRMSEEMAVICETVKKQTTKAEWEDIKAESEYCYQLTASGESVVAVRVLQKGKTAVQRAPIYQDQGYIYLYQRPFAIYYEDAAGRLYSAKGSFRLRKMISGEHIYTAQPKEEIPDAGHGIHVPGRREKLDRFAGSIREMEELIREADAEGIEVTRYWEQLMIRMLFTDKMSEDHEQIFSLIQHDPESGQIQDAYASRAAWKYLTEDVLIPQKAAAYIRDNCARRRTINPYCPAAFLKSYAALPRREDDDLAQRILEDYLLDGVYFDFIEKLPLWMRRKYMLFGMKVVQYRGTPGEIFHITFGSHSKELRENVPGVYAMRVELLAGERKDYTITDQDGNPLEYGVIEEPERRDEWQDTRYGKMCSLLEHPEDQNLQHEYAGLCDLTEALFIPVKE